MTKLTINIILPFPVTKPVGGAKIMYEYANRLAQKGHKVSIFHSIKRPYKKSKTPTWLSLLIYKLRNVARPKWFALDASINSYIVPAIINKHIPNADVTFCTWWQMAFAINNLSSQKGKKINLIQDYEIWGNQQTLVNKSYTLPITHIVIANYLYNLVLEIANKAPQYVPNAIDSKKFYFSQNIESRNAFTVIMLYSKEGRKASEDGINALAILQKKYPQLNAVFFGVYPKPSDLPQWVTYYQKPTNLQELYNQSAIFLSPSISEGWALPPAEAMACGCAVVCTDIGGHTDYAIHNNTALLVQKNNVEDIVEKIESLFLNDNLRHSIATNGNKKITTDFSWEENVNHLEKIFTTNS